MLRTTVPIMVMMWMLLTQGTGPSSSAIVSVGSYETKAACERDATKLKEVFWTKTLCLEVSGPPGVR